MVPSPLVIERVSKSFGGKRAVTDLSFAVQPGSVLGFLGPNGAGKSTTLRMALGVIAPDSGSVALFGGAPRMEALSKVGFLPEERGLYRRMTALGTIAYFGRLKGLSGREARGRGKALLEAQGLGEAAAKPISKLSKGMAQKVQILAALVHQPSLIILDEPFSGLDPVNQQGLEELIREAHAGGATVIFSTHVMEHAERLCDRLVIIARGEKRFEGTPTEALALLPRRALVTVANGFDLAGALMAHGFSATPDTTTPGGWHVDLPPSRNPQDALKTAVAAGAPVVAFMPETVRLRDVFVSLVGEGAAASDDPAIQTAGAP